ncbi:MFS general substrate transporter [Microthyrium microscopicum]|uniref:MFS general substrate transporter n=1 Tax=Microthyrium microscopicum TaxID=703497 RepID=A0A6A6UJX3_9PEZI|nr:MFS general substrate transporter [Microthyrium microscopicum]
MADPETAPLLDACESTDEQNGRDGNAISAQKQRSSEVVDELVEHWQKFSTLYIISMFALIIDISFGMMITPMSRLLELGVCRNFYAIHDPSVIQPGGDVLEQLCKIAPVQSKLAEINGILGMLGALPGLLFSIPYGIMADTYGRKVISAVSIVGLSLGMIWFYLVLIFYEVFPIEAVYAFPVFFIIGGGGPIISALIQAMIADVTPVELRGRVYMLMAITPIAGFSIGPLVGAKVMDLYGPSWAFLWSIPPRFFSLILLYFIPETGDFGDSETGNASSIPNGQPDSTKSFMGAKIQKLVDHARHDVWPIIRKTPVMLGMVSLVVNNFGTPIVGVLIQYFAAKFHWSYSSIAYVITYQSIVQIVMLLTFLPLADFLLRKRYATPELANLALSKISIFFLVAGCIALGLVQQASGAFFAIIIYVAGVGYAPSLRSFMTSLVPRDDTALLFALIGVFDSFGSLAGAPILAWAFSTGINIGGIATGLPFFVAGLIFGLSGITIWLIRPPIKLQDTVDGSEEEESEAE